MKLWASRFHSDISKETLDYTETVDIDKRMIRSDLWASLAHVLMLCHQRIVPMQDGRALVKCLLRMFDDSESGRLRLDRALEDVHLNIEAELIRQLGLEIGGKVHTARSRNDQVVTDTRIYIREEIIKLCEQVLRFGLDLIGKAREHGETLMLGRTHSQPAQPISYAFWLTSYSSILLRDAERLLNAYTTVNKNPLGACALAGTSFPIDRQITTRLLGFDQVLLHALDATSSRDFMIETAATLAILMSNISRLCEEVVCYSGFEHAAFDVGDSFATGSSIMPQKRNPVVAELARARSAVVYGSLFELLTVVKGVSLGYSCDLQQDKPPLWRALDTTKATLSILNSQVLAIKYDPYRAKQGCWNTFCTATELANHIVQEGNMSFREAYDIVGRTVKELVNESRTLADAERVKELLMLNGVEIGIDQIEHVTDPGRVLMRQQSPGGTGPKAVVEIVRAVSSDLTHLLENCREKSAAVRTSLDCTLRIAGEFINGHELFALLAY
jgi:argininosuccinate lyase